MKTNYFEEESDEEDPSDSILIIKGKNLYPDLSNEKISKNVSSFLLLYKNIFFNPEGFISDEQRDFVIKKVFLGDSLRDNNISDWLYEDTPVKWPSYVERIFYTDETHDNVYRQVSFPVNLFLNIAYKEEKTITFKEVGYINILLLYTKYGKVDFEIFQKEFFNPIFFYGKKNTVHLFHHDPMLVNIKSIPIDEPQLTTVRYKDFYDVIPICNIPPKKYSRGFLDTRLLLVSDFCFHKPECHYPCRHNSICEKHHDKEIMVEAEFKKIKINDLLEEKRK